MPRLLIFTAIRKQYTTVEVKRFCFKNSTLNFMVFSDMIEAPEEILTYMKEHSATQDGCYRRKLGSLSLFRKK